MLRLLVTFGVLGCACAFTAPRLPRAAPTKARRQSQLRMLDASAVDLLQNSAFALSYSDDQNAFLEGFDPLVAGGITVTTAVIGGLFTVLAGSLRGGSNLAVSLSEEEQAAVDRVTAIFDPKESDRELTEAGTVGEVARKQQALKAKDAYQAGKNDRDVRDKTLSYAEVDLAWLATLLRQVDPQPGEVFLDLGSGMGKAVLGAAALYPQLKKCSGIEILPQLHSKAQGYGRKLRGGAKTEFLCEDFVNIESPKVKAMIGEADIIFAFATSFASQSDTLTETSAVLAELAKPGARIVTLDRRVRGPFKGIKEVDDLRGDLQLTRGFIAQKQG